MAAYPVGVALDGLVLGRLVPPRTRPRLVRPMLLTVPLLPLPALADPPAAVVALPILATGVAGSVHLPLDGLFPQVLPDGFRARAFGVIRSGMRLACLVEAAVRQSRPATGG
ncbi:hypothetical protein HD597_004643 [Nonomuraea thailandensis]|uniref:Uncharacterized protein n=1 Tax=Nonomuraea thailandensis TaxID=1188745 RepID=A0A9X2K254_9ACTN|nr:hypothetical protein [Nonomuraea thailandensis]MCP2357623.1 hypothetical protein [Nonomuraea thailandensis]